MLRLAFVVTLLLGILVMVSGCALPQGTEPAQGQQGFDWTLIAFLVLIFGVFYFLMVRPQRKRQKQQQSMVQELQKGDKVVTAGGVFGTIESVSDDSIVLKVEGGTTIRFAKSSVVGKREQK